MSPRLDGTPADDPRILVIDVGGSNLKGYVTGREGRWKTPSGPDFTPRDFLEKVAPWLAEAKPHMVSIGFPAETADNKILEEPQNLGGGWKGFDLAAALSLPCKVVNDAAMQALGSYPGVGRMLFLGLGTGLGSALIDDGHLLALELGRLRFTRSQRLEDVISKKNLKKVGPVEWERLVWEVVNLLRISLLPDVITLGGGNAAKLQQVPEGIRIGSNRDAFYGGVKLWEKQAHQR